MKTTLVMEQFTIESCIGAHYMYMYMYVSKLHAYLDSNDWRDTVLQKGA